MEGNGVGNIYQSVASLWGFSYCFFQSNFRSSGKEAFTVSFGKVIPLSSRSHHREQSPNIRKSKVFSCFCGSQRKPLISLFSLLLRVCVYICVYMGEGKQEHPQACELM